MLEDIIKEYQLKKSDYIVNSKDNVIKLILNNKNLSIIPQKIKKFKFLKELHLQDNNIQEINNLVKFTKLEILNLKGNNIHEIKNLKNLENLTGLDLASNMIEEIKHLEGLYNLKKLILKDNEISYIEGLDNQHNLKSLNLSNNHIKRISGLYNLKKLSHVNLDGNPLIKEHEKIYKKSLKELVKYCKKNKYKMEPRYIDYLERTKLQIGDSLDVSNPKLIFLIYFGLFVVLIDLVLLISSTIYFIKQGFAEITIFVSIFSLNWIIINAIISYFVYKVYFVPKTRILAEGICYRNSIFKKYEKFDWNEFKNFKFEKSPDLNPKNYTLNLFFKSNEKVLRINLNGRERKVVEYFLKDVINI